MKGMGERFGISMKWAAICLVAYVVGHLFFLFGNKAATLFGFDKDWIANFAVFIVIFVCVVFLWLHYRKENFKK